MRKIIVRIFVALLGLGLLGSVVWLGFIASTDSTFVVWFGIASAILAPAGFAAISYSLTAGKNDTLARLEKIPEIQNLIEEAKTQEEKIKLLEQDRKQLVAAVELETRKQALVSRRDSLEADAVDLVAELEGVDNELSSIDSEIDNSSVKEIVSNLSERLGARKRGDIVLNIGGRYVTLSRDFILSMPMGRFFLSYFQLIESITQKRKNG